MYFNQFKTCSAALLIITCLNALSFAGGVGTTGAQFLKIGVGARAMSMGGAYSAIAEGPEAMYWNPAALALHTDREATAAYTNYLQGIGIGFLGYTQPLCCGTMGIGANYLTVGGIERRTTDVDTAEGTFGANDMAAYLSYGCPKLAGRLLQGLNLGANVKFIRMSIDNQTAQSYAIDAAALYQTPVNKLTAGLGVYNIGSQVKFIDEADPLPMDIRLGVAYRMLADDALLVAVDADDYVTDARIYTKIGAEYTYRKLLSLRAGYKLGMDSTLGGSAGLGTGIGVNLWNIKFDYAFVPFGELSDTHWISISTKF